MITIVTANQKGGVGKTTTTVHFAHGAALAGYQTMIIDVDPQGNVTDSLGLPEGNDLIGFIDNPGGSNLATPARENLTVIRSDIRTAQFKTQLSGRDYREYVLSESIHQCTGVDLVFIDCAPSVDVLHIAALVAADWLIIPTKLDQFSIKGTFELLETISRVNRRGASVALAGVLPTFFDRQTNETQLQLEHLVAGFGGQIWPVIPQDTNIRVANRKGKTLWEYAPSSRAITGIPGIGGGYQAALKKLLGLL